MNFIESQGVLSSIEKIVGNRVLCFYTPENMSINQNHPDIFIDQLRNIGFQEKISLIIISNGGDSSASLRIAYTLRDYANKIEVLVPTRCASAATVLALSADKIVMSPTGYLTAIDSALDHPLNPKGPDSKPSYVSVDQVKRVISFLNKEGNLKSASGEEGPYRTLFKYVHPLVIGEVDRLSSRTILIAQMMMKMHPHSFESQEKIDWIASHLYNDYPEHGFPIMYKEALEIGLPVEKATNELTDLMIRLSYIYKVSTLPSTTYFSENHYRKVIYTNLVESVGQRTVFLDDTERRLNTITKMWQYEVDIAQWVKVMLSPEDNRVKIYPMDIAFDSRMEASQESSQPNN